MKYSFIYILFFAGTVWAQSPEAGLQRLYRDWLQEDSLKAYLAKPGDFSVLEVQAWLDHLAAFDEVAARLYRVFGQVVERSPNCSLDEFRLYGLAERRDLERRLQVALAACRQPAQTVILTAFVHTKLRWNAAEQRGDPSLLKPELQQILIKFEPLHWAPNDWRMENLSIETEPRNSHIAGLRIDAFAGTSYFESLRFRENTETICKYLFIFFFDEKTGRRYWFKSLGLAPGDLPGEYRLTAPNSDNYYMALSAFHVLRKHILHYAAPNDVPKSLGGKKT